MKEKGEKKWVLKEEVPGEFLDKFPEYSPRTLQLLWDRRLKTQKEIDEFFNPDYDEDLHDPFLFKDMHKAVERVIKAIQEKEKIYIYGDYDHDGICGSAILYLFLKELGIKPEIYIPDRQKEGYGLNLDAVKEIAKAKPKLLITVDCGASDFKEVGLAKELGIEVVILDHHLIPGKLPPAHAIINAHQKDDNYPFKELAAVGIVFKTVQALIQSLKGLNQRAVPNRVLSLSKDSGSGQATFNLKPGMEKWFLDLVAIATVGDVVPLLGENRTLVKYGLVVLAQTRRPGLKALMKVAGIKPRLQEKLDTACKIPITNLDTYALSYIIVPRINAAGRMDHANTAFELVVADLEEEAEVLAKRLNDKNRDRQNLVERIIKDIEARLENKKLPPLIFEGHKSWSIGVAGLVAGKIVDKYQRPTFVFEEQKDTARGSGRSVEGFNLVEAMESCGDIFEEFGGHAEAGGFTVKKKNLEKLQNGLLKFAKKSLKEEDLVPKIDIDVELEPNDINWEFYGEIEKFEPFGEENPKPLFLMSDLEVSILRYVGQNGRHLQLGLKTALHQSKHGAGQAEKNFRGIYFSIEDSKKNLKVGDRVDVVFELMVDEWNGTRELRLKIVDLKGFVQERKSKT